MNRSNLDGNIFDSNEEEQMEIYEEDLALSSPRSESEEVRTCSIRGGRSVYSASCSSDLVHDIVSLKLRFVTIFVSFLCHGRTRRGGLVIVLNTVGLENNNKKSCKKK